MVRQGERNETRRWPPKLELTFTLLPSFSALGRARNDPAGGGLDPRARGECSSLVRLGLARHYRTGELVFVLPPSTARAHGLPFFFAAQTSHSFLIAYNLIPLPIPYAFYGTTESRVAEEVFQFGAGEGGEMLGWGLQWGGSWWIEGDVQRWVWDIFFSSYGVLILLLALQFDSPPSHLHPCAVVADALDPHPPLPHTSSPPGSALSLRTYYRSLTAAATIVISRLHLPHPLSSAQRSHARPPLGSALAPLPDLASTAVVKSITRLG